ncbi:hypothetical protein AX17_005594 [Amanita inopinata Kibby_2008]|nr:hypothetical protein AX17_005594 [Amanita inopinata Kibby_2008]
MSDRSDIKSSQSQSGESDTIVEVDHLPVQLSNSFHEKLEKLELGGEGHHSTTPFLHAVPFFTPYFLNARLYSLRFPISHALNSDFLHAYQLEDELGFGGYGFVMTAYHRTKGSEVAVKFIIKAKVPEHAWIENDKFGRLPTEIILLSVVDHENIIKCVDWYEDTLYFYLVQELHGSPWHRTNQVILPSTDAHESNPPTPHLSIPPSERSLGKSELHTVLPSLIDTMHWAQPQKDMHATKSEVPEFLYQTSCLSAPRLTVHCRPPHDLFECIEQSQHKRLTEDQARYVFAQVVEAVYYLDSRGITHRDIKDENLVIDTKFKVKLIDFGSATMVDPHEPRPFYKHFYGTAAYAASEILRNQSYQAPPAEIWTLGVLLSYILTGGSPFTTVEDAIAGRIVFFQESGERIPTQALNLMRKCLNPDPRARATIKQVRTHPWLAPETPSTIILSS